MFKNAYMKTTNNKTEEITLKTLQNSLKKQKVLEAENKSLTVELQKWKETYGKLHKQALLIQQELKNSALPKTQYETITSNNNNTIEDQVNSQVDCMYTSKMPQGDEYQNSFPYVVDNKTQDDINFKKKEPLKKRKYHLQSKGKFLSKDKDSNYVNFKIQKLKRIRDKLLRDENKERLNEHNHHGGDV